MSCKNCIKYNNCPDPFTKELLSEIFDDNEEMNMDKLCRDYSPDPTADPTFIITIWR